MQADSQSPQVLRCDHVEKHIKVSHSAYFLTALSHTCLSFQEMKTSSKTKSGGHFLSEANGTRVVYERAVEYLRIRVRNRLRASA